MLDTIILTIPKNYCFITKPEMFTPNANILNNQGNYFVKCMNNPSASDKRNGIYRPRLTLIKRPTKYGNEISLKIEFSVTKMLYGNNVDEVQENDFDAVVEALRKSMAEMGVLVFSEQMRNAPVSAFHPSKNIELTDGYTSNYVISELRKINLTKKLSLNKADYRDNGASLQLYANSHSLVVYDKVKDLKTPEKRAIDKDQNKLQLSLFEMLTNKKEILRMEVRLTKKVKLNAVIAKLGFKENPTFKDIFNKNLCQKILQHYWQELILGENLFLFDMDSNPKTTLEKIFKHKSNIKPKEAIYLVGLRVLSKEGIRDTRAIVERHGTSRTWYRIAQDLPLLDEISDKVYHKWVQQITDCLTIFEPFKINKVLDLPCKAL